MEEEKIWMTPVSPARHNWQLCRGWQPGPSYQATVSKAFNLQAVQQIDFYKGCLVLTGWKAAKMFVNSCFIFHFQQKGIECDSRKGGNVSASGRRGLCWAANTAPNKHMVHFAALNLSYLQMGQRLLLLLFENTFQIFCNYCCKLFYNSQSIS